MVFNYYFHFCVQLDLSDVSSEVLGLINGWVFFVDLESFWDFEFFDGIFKEVDVVFYFD